MAGFLRKKSKPEQFKPAPPSSANAPPATSGSTGSAPLFARFASTQPQQPPPAPKIVSSPMLLSGNSRREPAPRVAGRAHGVDQTRRQLPLETPPKQTRANRTFEPDPPKPREQKRAPMGPPAHDRMLQSNHATAQARPISRYELDKPLPPPAPDALPTAPVTRQPSAPHNPTPDAARRRPIMNGHEPAPPSARTPRQDFGGAPTPETNHVNGRVPDPNARRASRQLPPTPTQQPLATSRQHAPIAPSAYHQSHAARQRTPSSSSTHSNNGVYGTRTANGSHDSLNSQGFYGGGDSANASRSVGRSSSSYSLVPQQDSRRPAGDPSAVMMSPPMRQALPRIFQAQAGENGAPYVNMHNGASIAPAPVRGKPRIFAAAEESSAMYPTNVEDMAAKSYPSPPTEFSPPKRRPAHMSTAPPASSRISNDHSSSENQSRRLSASYAFEAGSSDQNHDRRTTADTARTKADVSSTRRTPSDAARASPEMGRPAKHKLKKRPTTPASPTKHSDSGLPIAEIPDADVSLLDDDPFARVEGVQLMRPSSRTSNTSKAPTMQEMDAIPSLPPSRDGPPPAGSGMFLRAKKSRESLRKQASRDGVSLRESPAKASSRAGTRGIVSPPPSREGPRAHRISKAESEDDFEDAATSFEPPSMPTPIAEVPMTPPQPEPVQVQQQPSPVSPKDYKAARSQRRGAGLERRPPSFIGDVEVKEVRIPGPFPLHRFLTSDPKLLSAFLEYQSFFDWCGLSRVSKATMSAIARHRPLREVVLERYLRTVGYRRWAWGDADPLSLSLRDLNDYMRGVTFPTYEYARYADAFNQQLRLPAGERDIGLAETVCALRAATRAYNRVVLRLRAQGERQAKEPLPASRPPSPSVMSHGHSTVSGHASSSRGSPVRGSTGFRSPLFTLRRAPLLRVFVPSPEGDWLSDASILECEAELRRAGVMQHMRLGDVAWDIAVGDEGNAGRLIWDGSYLIDLDYTYSPVGDTPRYIPSMAFSPSYFHRVIRTGPSSQNPIVRVDISPWGQEIAANLQLLQDRARTETPQGAYHNVVRWVHRSSFIVRPRRSGGSSVGHGGSSVGHGARPPSSRIPIRGQDGLFVDPGWYGTIVVETEGTNEALADLQERSGPGAFPPRAGGPVKRDVDNRDVFRIVRERSRPGEIWLRTVSTKERIV